MSFRPSPILILLCLVGSAYMGYNFYRAWFELEDMRAFIQENLNSMPDSSPYKRFFLRRLNYPGWGLETRIVSTLNFVLMLGITGFVFYLYFANK